MTRRLAAAATACACFLALAGGAQAARTADILGFYNTDRAANGLPIVTTINGQMELGCANHDHYMALNGVLEHGEDPSKPGYTPEGNYLNGADGAEVLANWKGWSASFEPWFAAPIHLYLMFDPTVAQVAYADAEGYQCMRMRGPDVPDAQPAPIAFYAWTSDKGPSQVPYSEHAGEIPYVPQQLAGIPAAQTTGPNILLFSAGDAGTPLSATLSGPGGPVAVALVNANSKNSVGDGSSWFTGGGVLIPVRPLKPSSTYTATVQWDDNGPQTQTFSFTTTKAIRANAVAIRIRADGHGRRRIFVKSSAPNPALVVTGPGGRKLQPHVSRGRTAWMRLAHGQWNVCASSGGLGTDFSYAGSCVGVLS